MVALHVAGGGAPLRWAPWTSHLEGNCCAFQLARPSSPERATPQPAHTENPQVSKTPSASPTGLGERKKNNTGWFVQVIIFIPEQLEDTSLNVLPRELSESQRSGRGAGGGRVGRSAAPSCTHTLHSESLKRPGLRGTLRAVCQKLQVGITPQRSLCQCPCTPRQCSSLWHRGTSGPD